MIARGLTADNLRQSPDLANTLLALNNANATELTWLDAPRLTQLVDEAFVCLHLPPAQALLIAFDQDADYDSPNFRWFRERYEMFAYVDRIVVAESARGQNFARHLYHQLFDLAREAGHSIVFCEVNSDPPNPGSDAFHARMGFEQVGSARLENGKSVRYLAKAPD